MAFLITSKILISCSFSTNSGLREERRSHVERRSVAGATIAESDPA